MTETKAVRQMYSVTCADCGKATEVPFKPSPDRPVYCQDCFAKRRAAQNPPKKPQKDQKNPLQQKGGQNGQAIGLGEIKRSLDQLNGKLDRLIQSLDKSKAPVVAATEEPKAEKAEKKPAAKKKATPKKK